MDAAASVKNLGGRPKKAEHERRVRKSKVGFTIAEFNYVTKKAIALGKSVTELMRDLALSDPDGVRFSIPEMDYVRAKAEELETTPEDYIRDLVLADQAPDPDQNPETKQTLAKLVRELNSIGVNLNQLTRDYNSDRPGVVDWTNAHNDLMSLLYTITERFK